MASPGKKSYPLRVRPEVMEAVEMLAASELRSTNSMLEMLLREALMKRGIKLPVGRKSETDQ
ncbi:hypothetical protein ABI_27510 [Asticcacaulis biprosthecium C19]|uniref:Toxin-antitoxin system HicB family antitoxin n=1 Tax=Asticcacaulis biprosthecium C19 TaxID=715226 RepID=F4QM95_9CAUL|nr:hypothetical protein ABI_27510 [Asticcacaulis biprosthecium C19]